MIIEDLIQGSENWKEWRKGKISGTMASTCMNLNPFENQYDLWRRCLGLLPEIEENELMKKGKELEPIARRIFNYSTGINMTPICMVHPDFNWMICSLDGINYSGDTILEIKCGGEKLHEMVKNQTVPEYYMAQFQHCLEVSQCDSGYFMSYRRENGGDSTWFEIERDDDFIGKMIQAEKEFYRRLKEFDPPHPKHRKLETEEMQEAVDTYRLAKDMLARAEKHEQEARSKLLLLSQGECIEGYGLKVTHYTQRGSVDYNSIPELKGVDLDKYRKPPAIRTKITHAGD